MGLQRKPVPLSTGGLSRRKSHPLAVTNLSVPSVTSEVN